MYCFTLQFLDILNLWEVIFSEYGLAVGTLVAVIIVQQIRYDKQSKYTKERDDLTLQVQNKTLEVITRINTLQSKAMSS
jgi:hypothetical protein